MSTPANQDAVHNSVDPNAERRTSSQVASTNPAYKFNYDLKDVPRGKWVIGLTRDFMAHKLKFTGNPDKDSDLIAWFPMPDRDHEEEKRLGLLPIQPR